MIKGLCSILGELHLSPLPHLDSGVKRLSRVRGSHAGMNVGVTVVTMIYLGIRVNLTKLHTDFILSFLDIQDVKIAGKKAKWNLGERTEPYGSPLTIDIPEDHAGNAELEV